MQIRFLRLIVVTALVPLAAVVAAPGKPSPAIPPKTAARYTP